MTRELHCSFCGKSEQHVAKLVAGPEVYICDACIQIASRIIAADPGSSSKRPLWRRALDAARKIPRGFRRESDLRCASRFSLSGTCSVR
jgi:hypothetical protein